MALIAPFLIILLGGAAQTGAIVYAYRGLQPQSSGQAAFCADDSLSGHSSIVLGAPQVLPYPSPDSASGQPFRSLIAPVTQVADCSLAAGAAVSQTAPLGASRRLRLVVGAGGDNVDGV